MDRYNIAKELGTLRANLLMKSVDDAVAWSALPDGSVKRPSDQYWLSCFPSAKAGHEDAHKFLSTYQLSKMISWDKIAVASVINALAANENFVPTRDMERLAQNLAGCISSKNSGARTSAASKIAMFAQPKADVFIWDQLATRSARLRLELSGYPQRSLTPLFRKSDQSHDYAAYSAACQMAWDDERRKTDFECAVEDFIHRVRLIGGPMADPLVVGRNFAERRVLDKLMFWEGHTIRQLQKA